MFINILDVFVKNHAVQWESEGVEYTGVPFMIVGQRTLDCHHGLERNGKVKEKYKLNKEKRKVGLFHNNSCRI